MQQKQLILLMAMAAGAIATALSFGHELAALNGASALAKGLTTGAGTFAGMMLAGHMRWFAR